MMRLSDIGLTPGGQAVANARAWNALANDMLVNRYYGPNMQSQIDYRNAGTNRLNTMTPLEAQQLQIQNQFAPMRLSAEAASKLAYARLMGPQFVSKLISNPAIFPNISDAEKAQLINAATSAGTGNVFSQPQGMMGIPSMQQNIQPLPVNNQLLNTAPVAEQSLPFNNNQQPMQYPPIEQNSSFAENQGRYQGIVKEQEALGAERAKQISELGDVIGNAQRSEQTLNDLGSILSSPIFEQMRTLPVGGKAELNYWSKFGTPEQQQMVGQFNTLAGNLVKDASRDFAGQFRRGEQQLLEGMKPNANDTVNTARGKVESLQFLNRMLMQRSRLAADIMRTQHVDKAKAIDLADQQLNGDAIRQAVHDKLNPRITIRNSKTGETKTVSREEARAMGVPNV